MPRALWEAKNTQNYCERKAAEFIEKLSSLGWRCFSDDLETINQTIGNRYKVASESEIPTGKVKIEVETRHANQERMGPDRGEGGILNGGFRGRVAVPWAKKTSLMQCS